MGNIRGAKMKPQKRTVDERTVDDRLPKWLHSKILSAVDFIWQGKQMSMEESLERVRKYLSRQKAICSLGPVFSEYVNSPSVS